jgi:hypothetical protein
MSSPQMIRMFGRFAMLISSRSVRCDLEAGRVDGSSVADGARRCLTPQG